MFSNNIFCVIINCTKELLPEELKDVSFANPEIVQIDGEITPNYNPELLNIDIIKEIQASMAKSAPVDFDFEINVFTNEHGVETMEVIDIQ